MSFWVVSFGGEEWISCFHKEDKQTNKLKICFCRDIQLSFFLSFLLSIDQWRRKIDIWRRREGNVREEKRREEKKEEEQEQEFFGLEIRFCEFSGFVGEGVDVAAVLLTLMVCG
jgi:hypothetical protein